ncbi:MAG: hypothetical protein NTZ49_03495 [Candidatus Parcubacteria bacterium]|nr:hypothetical protein [Candidatus Parcubacteria bacterium]
MKKIFLIYFVISALLSAEFVLAADCSDVHPSAAGTPGACVAGPTCPSGQLADSSTGLCPVNQTCCYKVAAESALELESGDIQDITLQVPIFGVAQVNNLAQYIKVIYQYALIILVPFAIIMIIVGGARWILSAGNTSKIGEAKKQITYALTGLFLGLFSYIILSFIGITSLKLPVVQYIEPEPDVDLSVPEEMFAFSSDPAVTQQNQAAAAAIKGSNPYQQICAKYSSQNYQTVANECKALGTTPPPDMNLVSMGAYGVGSQLAESAAFADFKKSADCVLSQFGKKVTASAWRSAASQYATKLSKGAYAAKPCCSNHGSGTAFDVRLDGASVQSWSVSDQYLKACFNQNGLQANLRKPRTTINEPWHWSRTGF